MEAVEPLRENKIVAQVVKMDVLQLWSREHGPYNTIPSARCPIGHHHSRYSPPQVTNHHGGVIGDIRAVFQLIIAVGTGWKRNLNLPSSIGYLCRDVIAAC